MNFVKVYLISQSNNKRNLNKFLNMLNKKGKLIKNLRNKIINLIKT